MISYLIPDRAIEPFNFSIDLQTGTFKKQNVPVTINRIAYQLFSRIAYLSLQYRISDSLYPSNTLVSESFHH